MSGNGSTKFYIAGAVGVIVLLISIFAIGRFFNHPDNTAPVETQAVFVPVTMGDPTVQASQTSQVASSAPACGEDYMSSFSKLIKETLRDCNNGAPYTNYLIPAGTTYKVLEDGFTCTPSATRDDGDVITCTGKNLALFKIEFCNLPDAPALVTASAQCSEGSGFDQAGQCCAPVSEKGTACFVYTARTKSCN